jgi:hypothetical protein
MNKHAQHRSGSSVRVSRDATANDPCDIIGCEKFLHETAPAQCRRRHGRQSNRMDRLSHLRRSV